MAEEIAVIIDGSIKAPIPEACSKSNHNFFIISTHIIEVGEALSEKCDNFRFFYMPTIMDGVRPRYTYQLTKGITTDRQGMLIIENEGIIGLLNARTPD
ncbi:hypothetical protein GA0116948_108110 [Chitinophaga costaii]|uniref:Uncharacterized protein n=1 Tax=Chitinophaga costaii TaxID=1335309 RepID=A0A1C4EHA9_9BACT|nr:hypothetical protein [Chitinophaga costaii]PUZ23825.1 hypothetical protein DCM91_13595 [Chitinophaga costaii]SCC42931.1 hypothetical protein GA0116948_108110 [Chitinophaga costaii]